MDESTLKKILESRDYDIRKSGNGRFMDQKCIPDVVCAVAECVLDYVDGDNLKTFTKMIFGIPISQKSYWKIASLSQTQKVTQ